MKFEIQFYKRAQKNPIMEFILSLEEDLQLDILATLRKLEENPFSMGSMSKKIEGVQNLFELRVRGRQKIVRLFYCYQKNRIIILLHGFVKKTQKTPQKELELAIQRKKEIENERP